MKCQRVTKKLSAFLDGETKKKDKEAISRHLESCEDCAQVVRELTSLSVLLRQGEDKLQASPYFWNKIEKAIIQAETQRNPLYVIGEWFNRTLVPVGATMAILLGLLIGTNLGGVIYARIANILNPGRSSAVQQEMDRSLQLNTLSDFPKESIGEIYNGLLAQNNVKK